MTGFHTAPLGTLPPGWTEIGHTDDFPIGFAQKEWHPGAELVLNPLIPRGQMFITTTMSFDPVVLRLFFGEDRRHHVARKLGVAMRKAEARQSARKTLRSIRRYLGWRELLTPR